MEVPRKGGNGHNDINVLDPSDLRSLFKLQGGNQSVAREFVHPGKEAGELLMRTYFRTPREATLAVRFLHKCEKFGLERGKKMLLHKLSANTSVGGRSRVELLQGVTGYVIEGLNRRERTRKEEEERSR